MPHSNVGVAIQFILIVNVDECGCNTQGKDWTYRVLVRKGSDAPFAPVIGERGQHITTIACVCCDGTVVAPTVVLPGTGNFTPEQLKRYAPDTSIATTENGWSNSAVFVTVLHSIVKHVGQQYPEWKEIENPMDRKPILVMLDGHGTHDSADALEYCMEQNIFMVASPAHCTHVLQILDSHKLFGAFQKKLSKYIQLHSMDGHPVDVRTFGTAFTHAWEDVFHDSDRIVKAFKEYGVFPLDYTALNTDKLSQHAALQETEHFKNYRADGMSNEEARAAARKRMTTPPIDYEHQWEHDIVNHFMQAAANPVAIEDEDTASLRDQVMSCVMKVQTEAIRKRAAETPEAAVKRKRRRSACNTDRAIVLTSQERLEEAKKAENAKKQKEDKTNKKRQYDLWRKIESERIKQENRNNKERLVNAKANLKTCKQALKTAQKAVAKAEKASTTTTSTARVSSCLYDSISPLTMLLQRTQRSLASDISVEDAQAAVEIAAMDVDAAEELVQQLAPQPLPPTFAAKNKQEQMDENSDTSNANTRAVRIQSIDKASEEGNKIAEEFPGLMERLMAGNMMENLSLAVLQRKMYLSSSSN
jgi:hypothetical protein